MAAPSLKVTASCGLSRCQPTESRGIRGTLRLHLQATLSYNEVGRALKIPKSVAGKYISLARAAGVDWELAQTLSDEDLEARLFRPAVPRSSHQLAPDFALVHQELKRAGVALQLLWEEYARDLGDKSALAYKYTSSCIKYRAFAQGPKRSMHHRRTGATNDHPDHTQRVHQRIDRPIQSVRGDRRAVDRRPASAHPHSNDGGFRADSGVSTSQALMERAEGIEPPFSDSLAVDLPLIYARARALPPDVLRQPQGTTP